MASTAIGFLTTAINYFAPEKVFAFLLATSGAVALLVYLVIAVSQLRMRKQLIASGQELGFKMWLYPWLTWLVIIFITVALCLMLTLPKHTHEVASTAVLALVIVGTGLYTKRRSNAAKWSQGVASNTHR
ncbi:putative GABA permease [compost metagenome]